MGDMSGGLAGAATSRNRNAEGIRTNSLQVSQPGLRDSICPPLRYGATRDAAHLCYLRCSSESVDYGACSLFHARILDN